MGLKERRFTQEFIANSFPALQNEINQAAGFSVPLEISWDTLFEDTYLHLYNDTYPKVYFLPLIEALKAIAVDDFGRELLQKGLQKVSIVNTSDHHSPERGMTFTNGVLTIDHSPVLNADKVEERAEYLITLLEDNLDDFASGAVESESTDSSSTTQTTNDAAPGITIHELFLQNAVITYEKQLVFNELVGERGWDFNMTDGTVSFEEYVFPMQILGTYSEREKSWMWAWANKQSGIPENLLKAAYHLQNFGNQGRINELMSPSFEATENTGHFFGQIAAGIYNASCYCPVVFKGTHIYVLIDSEMIDEKLANDAPTIVSRFTQAISNMNLDHKVALYYYLTTKGYEVKAMGNNLLATKEDDQILGLFDLNSRLLKINTSKV